MFKNLVNVLFFNKSILKDAHPSSTPSDGYLEVVNVLDNVVRDCIHVSKSYGGIPSKSNRHYHASILFTTLCTKAITLVTLMPHTSWADKIIEHWDYSSLATLTRSILEARIAFYYLCVEKCSSAEWGCRWNIFNLHDCNMRIRLLTNDSAPEEVIINLEKVENDVRSRLQKNKHFKSLTEKQQKMYLKGRHAYLYSIEDIAEKTGIDKKTFKSLYIMFSASAHSLPMSFYNLGKDEGRGLYSDIEEHYTSVCLSLTAMLLASSRDELHELFSNIKKK